MAYAASVTPARGRFSLPQWSLVAVGVLFVFLLSPVFGSGFRETASGLGLLVAGLAATVGGARRAIKTTGADSRPWRILAVMGTVLLLSNGWVAISGADPVTSPSLFSILSIAVALVMAAIALILFPGHPQRGRELVIMVLDGLVAGGGFLLIASVLVYSALLKAGNDHTSGVNSVFARVFPLLDVLLATIAVLLVVRARRSDRLMLVLVAAAFLLYAAADLAYAVRTAEGTFHFGTMLDLGWILGYLLLGVAALSPIQLSQGPEDSTDSLSMRLSDALGTFLVFAVFAAATVVQVVFGNTGRLEGLSSALWLVVVVATGVRQIMLTTDNAALRLGLERRVSEQTADLRRLARQNEVLITSVGDGVYGVDSEGRITFVNPSAASQLGFLPEQLQGVRAHEMFHGPDPEGAAYPWLGCYIHDAIADGLVSRSEEDEYVRADGSIFPVEITASPLLDDADVRGAVVTFRDVTQRREVDRMKNEFLSVVSHELRTPLTSIRGSLGLLAGGRMGELPQRAASLVNVAVQSTERLTRLINDLLDIERMQSGTGRLEVAALDAGQLLESTVRQIEGMATSMSVRVQVLSAEGRVLADQDQIIQTLLNLIGNAIKFSPPGSSVGLLARESGESEVLFQVIDSGRGVPADKLESIFERFEQVDSSDTRQKGGTGLGLAISRGIVERHGGRIWAESELGAGAVFNFTLPSAPTPSRSDDATRTRPGAPTILVCDDDVAVVEQFSELLRGHGYRPIGVTDGARAVELAATERPQAVVLDLLMPGTTGAQVLAALRAAESTRNIPVVVISGLGPESDTSVSLATEGWLIKPVSEERLVHAVSLALSKRHSSATVLLVEDDGPLADVIATMLADEGLDVVHATSAAQAVSRGQELHPDVIVLDLLLPDGNGTEVVAAFSQQMTLAQTPLVVYTSTDLEDTTRDQLQLGPTVFLTKGRTTPEELCDQVLGLVGTLTSGPVR